MPADPSDRAREAQIKSDLHEDKRPSDTIHQSERQRQMGKGWHERSLTEKLVALVFFLVGVAAVFGVFALFLFF